MAIKIMKWLHQMRRLVDGCILLCSFALIQYSPYLTIGKIDKNEWLLLAVLLGTWFIASGVTKLYKDRVSNKYVEEIVIVFYTLFVQFVLMVALLYVGNAKIAILFLVEILCFFGLLQLVIKYVIRKKIHYSFLNDTKLSQKLVIIGTNDSIVKLHQTITTHYYYGYNCVGYLSEKDFGINNLVWLGIPSDLKEIIDNKKIEKVIVSLPILTEEAVRFYLETCDAKGIKTIIVPNYYQFTSTSFEVDQIGLIPIINLRALPLDKFENKYGKRIFDIIFSSLFLILIASWFFWLVALLIKLTSKGPVFFVQERWGFNNKKMKCYKFRTMQMQKEATDVFTHTKKDDPRVTPIGKWFRILSIDEMPQFINVLMGSMSVVGPRPHVTPQNIEYMQKIDSYLLRHQVKPGLTGWAQVNGARGEIADTQDMQTRLNYDLFYIHRWSFWLDIQIILQTIVNIFKGDTHAY